MKQKTVFLYCPGIDDVLSGSSKVAGIQVQMSFWARTFSQHGWKALSYSEFAPQLLSDITFLKKFSSPFLSKLHLQSLIELVNCWRCIRCNPDLVVARGAQREFYYLSKLCRLKDIKFVLFGASDVNFIPGREQIVGSSRNRLLYQKAIRNTEFIVTQNENQFFALQQHYGKSSMRQPNIWIPSDQDKHEKKYDAIWVANLRPLKRAEWFISLAKTLSQYRFAIVGGAMDKKYYEKIEQLSSAVPNLSFLGAKSFEEVNTLLSESRLLVCTSEFEGFPNTFLQAWAQSVPVVSTVNPNGLLTDYKLGKYVETQEELCEGMEALISDSLCYQSYEEAIRDYFLLNHSAEHAFEKLMDYLRLS